MTGVLRLLAMGTLPCLLLLVPACGPMTYLSRVTFGASGKVAQAQVTGGEKMAPYEYTAATEYLQKSRELAGYARFHDANNFGQKSKDMAQKSIEVASSRERNNELPIFVPDGSMYIDKSGAVKKKGRPGASNQAIDNEKPPLTPADDEKPPLGDNPGTKSAPKGDPQ